MNVYCCFVTADEFYEEKVKYRLKEKKQIRCIQCSNKTKLKKCSIGVCVCVGGVVSGAFSLN